MITMTGGGADIQRERDRIKGIKGGFEKAFVRAAKRVASQGRTEISKGIRQHINIKAGDLKEQLKVDRHKKGASITLSETDRLSLKYFGATQNGKGVSYKINKGRGRGFIPGAFIVPSLGGHVFERRGAKVKMTKGRYQGKNKQRIYKLMGASAWGVFVVRSMYKPTEDDLKQKFNQRLRHEIDFLIAKGSTRV